ncbi:MAG: 5'/3'-nucleotidase SurE [Sphaerochaetaceae bacterium]
MRALVTNDDGILSEGLVALAAWAKRLGDVFVAAPKSEQSGKSQSINIHTPFEVKQCGFPVDGVKAWMIDSTPADCVRFALSTLMDADIVLSGINRGFNLGEDIGYSGTDGAVFEAAYFHKNAIAFSTITESFRHSIDSLDEIWRFFEENDLLGIHNLYNVNIPAAHKSLLVTRQAGAFFKDKYINIGNGMFKASGYSVYNGESDLTNDIDAVMHGYISISPLDTNRTAAAAYAQLSQLNENHYSPIHIA